MGRNLTVPEGFFLEEPEVATMPSPSAIQVPEGFVLEETAPAEGRNRIPVLSAIKDFYTPPEDEYLPPEQKVYNTMAGSVGHRGSVGNTVQWGKEGVDAIKDVIFGDEKKQSTAPIQVATDVPEGFVPEDKQTISPLMGLKSGTRELGQSALTYLVNLEASLSVDKDMHRVRKEAKKRGVSPQVVADEWNNKMKEQSALMSKNLEIMKGRQPEDEIANREESQRVLMDAFENPKKYMKDKKGEVVRAFAANITESLPLTLASIIPVGGQVITGASEGGRWQDEAKTLGITDPKIIRDYGTAYGIPSAAIEVYMNKVLLAPLGGKNNPLTGGIVKVLNKHTQKIALKIAVPVMNMIFGAVGEGGEEVAQGTLSDYVMSRALVAQAKIFIDNGHPEKARSLMENAVGKIDATTDIGSRRQEFLLGSLAGLGLGAGSQITGAVLKGGEITPQIAPEATQEAIVPQPTPEAIPVPEAVVEPVVAPEAVVAETVEPVVEETPVVEPAAEPVVEPVPEPKAKEAEKPVEEGTSFKPTHKMNRDAIKKAKIKELRDSAKNSKYPDGSSVWDIAPQRTKAGLQAALTEYMTRSKVIKPRRFMSPETRKKMSKARLASVEKQRWAKDEEQSKFVEEEMVKARESGALMDAGLPVAVKGESEDVFTSWNIIDVETPTAMEAAKGNFRYVVRDDISGETKTVSADKIEALVPEETEELGEGYDEEPGVQAAILEANEGTAEAGDDTQRGAKESDEDFKLEPASRAQVKAEDAKRAEKEKIKDLAAKPLKGDAGDITADMFGEGETPLFNEVRAKEEKKAPSTKKPAKDASGVTETVKKKKVEDTQAQKDLSPDEIEITDTGETIDLTKKGEKRKKGGFVSLPSVKQVEKTAKRIRKWIRRKAGTTKGLTTELSDKIKEWQRAKNAKAILAKADKSAFKIARDELARKTTFDKEGKNKALQDIRDVLYGEKTIEDLQQKYDLADDNAVVKFLNDYNARRKESALEIAALLKNRGAPEELIAKIEADEYYVTRFYEKHILGEDFVPDEADYNAAKYEIESGFEDVIEKLGARATKAVGKRINAPVAEYLRTGDVSLLAGLSKTRQKEIMAIKSAYDKVSQIVSAIDDSDGTIEFPIDARALRDAAESIIDYHLGKDSRKPGAPGSIDLSSLRKRHLKGVFRALYGEITDPLVAGPRTTEVQGKTMEDLAFFEQLFRDGEGKWWSNVPSNQKDHTVKLGGKSRSDSFKFGNMDGKYVSQELADILDPQKTENKALDFYMSTKSTMRLLKLYGPRTIVRNYVSALTGFTMGNGDMFRKGYSKNLKRGHTLLADVLAQKPAALKELADLAKKDVFRTTNNSILNDVEFILSGRADTKYKQGLQWLGEKYAYIDFPTKVASYWTAKDSGMSDAEAVDHVHKFYQNPDAVPEGLRDMSKLPLGDYPGYFFDSMRIAKNQVQYAVSSAKKGDPIPLMGFILSRGLQAAVWAGMTKKLDDLWDRMWEKIRGKEPKAKKDKKLESTDELALREFLPEYYKYGPLLASARTNNDGTKEIVFTINSNQFAFPFEDAMAGAIQSSGGDIGKGMGNLAKNIAQDRLRPGMLEEAAWKFFTGDAIDGSFKTKGISDLGAEDEDRNRILLEASGNFLLDVYGGQFGDMFKQMYAIDQRNKGGVATAGSYTSRKTVADVLKSKIAPWRTYKWDNDEMSRQVMFKLSPKAKEVANKRSQIRRASAENAKPKDIAIAVRARVRRIEMLQEMAGVVSNARLIMGYTGMYEDELEAVVKDASRGLAKDERDAVLNNEVSFLEEYEPDLRSSNRKKLYE